MRLDCQILLKSPPINLLAGSAPGLNLPTGAYFFWRTGGCFFWRTRGCFFDFS